MVFKKKFAPRRRQTRKRTGVTVKAVKKIVKSTLNKQLETKFHVSEISGAATGTSPNIFLMPSPGVGTTDADRESDTIYAKSLYYNYSFIYDDTTNLVRFIIFQWLNDSSNNPPVAASILEGSISSAVRAPYSMNNAQSYRILYDRTHTMSDAGSNAVILRKGYITRIPNRKLVYTNTSAASANIKRGQLYGLIVSDSSVSGPSCSAAFKLNYTDA